MGDVGDVGDVVGLVNEPGVEIVAFVEEVEEPNGGKVKVEVAMGVHCPGKVTLKIEVTKRVVELVVSGGPLKT